jgi:hypothetical protein
MNLEHIQIVVLAAATALYFAGLLIHAKPK